MARSFSMLLLTVCFGLTALAAGCSDDDSSGSRDSGVDAADDGAGQDGGEGDSGGDVGGGDATDADGDVGDDSGDDVGTGDVGDDSGGDVGDDSGGDGGDDSGGDGGDDSGGDVGDDTGGDGGDDSGGDLGGDVGDLSTVEDIAGDATDVSDVGPGCVPPGVGDLVIVELLAAGNDLNTNCDGETDSTDDEFMEFVNVSDDCLDLTDVITTDNVTRIEFVNLDDPTVPPGGVVLVFSGGTPAFEGADSCAPLGACVQLLTDNLGLNNGSDTITLQRRVDEGDPVIIDVAEYTGATTSESLARTGPGADDWEAHSTGGNPVHSAGRERDGSNYTCD